jgi:hypothetical protein
MKLASKSWLRSSRVPGHYFTSPGLSHCIRTYVEDNQAEIECERDGDGVETELLNQSLGLVSASQVASGIKNGGIRFVKAIEIILF